MKQRLEENIVRTKIGRNPLFSMSMLLLIILTLALFTLSHIAIIHYYSRALAKKTEEAVLLINKDIEQWLHERDLIEKNAALNLPQVQKTALAVDDISIATYSYQIQSLLIKTKTYPSLLEFNIARPNTLAAVARSNDGNTYLLSWSTFTLEHQLADVLPSTVELHLKTNIDSYGSININKRHSTEANILDFLSYELIQLAKQEKSLTVSRPLALKGWSLLAIEHRTPLLPFIISCTTFILGLLYLYIPYWRNKLKIRKTMGTQTIPTLSVRDIAKVEHEQLNQAISGLAEEFPELAPSVKPQIKTTTPSVTPPKPSLLDLAKQQSQLTTETPKFTLDLNHSTSSGMPIIIPQEIFRAYDIRGDIQLLTPEVMSLIGKGMGAILHAKRQSEIAVGYDARLTSKAYAKILREALISSGMSVFDIGLIPTPVMHFAAQKSGNAIIVTASHNPASHNGIKWVINHQSPTETEIQELYQIVSTQQFVSGHGLEIAREDVVKNEYMSDILSKIAITQPLKVVIDGMHGSMGEMAASVLTAAGCELIALNAAPDGTFPSGNPDPSEKNRLTALSQSIVTNIADIGFAFDGDGDRLVVLDSKGQIISPDHLIIILAQIALANQPGADIVYDVKCSRIVAKAILDAGGRPIMQRSGNTFIRRAVLSEENNAVFGGEFAGHYLFNDARGHAIDDGLYVATRLLEWISHDGKSIDELVAELPPRFATGDVYIAKPSHLSNTFFDDLATDAITLKQVSISNIDGLRLDFEDGFAILRSSNTSNSLTARFDGDTAESLARIRNTVSELVKSYDAKLALQLSTLV